MSPRYRRKPDEIDALQWDGTADNAAHVIDWVLAHGGAARFHEAQDFVQGVQPKQTAWIAIDGPADEVEPYTIPINPGDWIIRNAASQFSPCRPWLFDKSYQPVSA